MIRVLFICSGNICRSPAAEGVFRAMVAGSGLADQIEADSAGTGSWHVGDPPDHRMQEAAKARGYDIGDLRARQITMDDFEAFDYLVAMDRGHHRQLTTLCPSGEQHRVTLFLDHAPQFGKKDVPDPYYGKHDGFALVMDMIEAGATGLLDAIRQRHL